ncbi:MAG: transglycosylase SLT domain-containing protein [Burkholderiaceae bacterium]
MPRIAMVIALVVTCGAAAADQTWELPTTSAPGDVAPTRAPPPTGLTAEAVKLEFGEGIGQNYAMAADLYCRAARKGDGDAAYRLGWMYANGRGMLRDDRIATGLFRYAAERSHDYAKRMLAHVNTAEAVLPACMIPPTVIAEESHALPLAWTATPERQRIVDIVREVAPAYGVEPRLALAIIQAESGFQTSAKSNMNAQGLMQLIPETAERFGVRKIMDPRENIRGGVAYLRWLLSFFEGDVTLVTAAYNAGERAVERYRGVPPYAETRQYVARVTGVYGKTTHKFNPGVVDPSPMVVLRRMQRLTAADAVAR